MYIVSLATAVLKRKTSATNTGEQASTVVWSTRANESDDPRGKKEGLRLTIIRSPPANRFAFSTREDPGLTASRASRLSAASGCISPSQCSLGAASLTISTATRTAAADSTSRQLPKLELESIATEGRGAWSHSTSVRTHTKINMHHAQSKRFTA